MRKKLVLFTSLGLLLLQTTTAVFAASPRTNYLLFCSGCHRPMGEGKPPNVPTLHDELGHMMNVNAMRGYLARVPGSAHAPISNAELTEVLNWLLEEFNAETLPKNFKKLTVGEVTEARTQILANPNKYREDHWKAYEF